jgi:SOS-response transcriptional repressor LexA
VNTKTQRVYEFIRDYIETHGSAPTHDEIAAGAPVAKIDVPNHLSRLAMHELIEYTPSKKRGIKLKQAPPYGEGRGSP